MNCRITTTDGNKNSSKLKEKIRTMQTGIEKED